MKARNLFFAVLASAAVLVGCEKKEDLGGAKLELSESSVTFDVFDTESSSKTISLTATRDWKAEWPETETWLTVGPASGAASGEAQSVEVIVKKNEGFDRETAVTFTIGTVTKTLNVIQKGAGGESQIETITVKEFIEKADSETEYTLKGTVSGIANTSFKGFELTDDTGLITCAFPDNFDEWVDKMSNGGVVIIRGKYSYYDKKEQHQLKNGIILDFKEVEAGNPVDANISDVLAGTSGTLYKTSGTVVALYNAGCVISDGTDNLLVYRDFGKGNTPVPMEGLKVGDVVTVTGPRAEYGNLPQIKIEDYTAIVETESGKTVTYPEPIAVDASNIAEFMSDRSKAVYFQFIGTLAISGNYYNVTIAGTEVQGSLSYPLESLNLSSLVGKQVKYTGYFCGGNIDKYLNMLVVKAEEYTGEVAPFLHVEAEEISVTADATEAEIVVKSNASWTAAVVGGAEIDKTSGENDGEIKVTFTANASETDVKTYTVTLKAADCDDVVVTITQAKKPAAGESVIYTLDTTGDLKGSNNSYSGNCDVEVDGITWNVNGNTQINPWRLGGKSITEQDRTVYSKTPFGKEVSKVVLTLGTTNLIINSCKLLYSTNADFSGALEMPFEYKEGEIELSESFPANCFYKFVFNVTVSGTSNKYVQFCKVAFWGKE